MRPQKAVRGHKAKQDHRVQLDLQELRGLQVQLAQLALRGQQAQQGHKALQAQTVLMALMAQTELMVQQDHKVQLVLKEIPD